MNVYDFDGTIYDGDSTVDFFFFALSRYPALLRFLPQQLWGFARYFLHLTDKTTMKENFYRFLRGIPDRDALLSAFWDSHLPKVLPWYRKQQAVGDVIISASPEFLLRPACERLGIRHLIASRVNLKTGCYTGLNCHGEEKVARFHLVFGDTPVGKFYSDSLSDLPMALLADRAFLVKRGRLSDWKRN